MSRGSLRVYLGAAPGVGKTFDMLSEGHRRAERGTDVVVGYVETHGRPHTAELLDGLEVVPRRQVTYRGTDLTELDLDAILARRPEVVLVDELAHTNAPGSTHEKRWQDVEALLHAGIDVISTVNIQHLESLNDVVAAITDVKQRETIPDDVVRRADQIELVDMSPEALRRRMAHGNVYLPEKVDAALANYFRVGNLTALRELALLWLADRVDDALESYRTAHGIDAPWHARERVVVALTGGAESDTLLRRAARIAGRGAGGELLAVHVSRGDGLTGAPAGALERQRALTESLGGTFHTVVGDDAAEAILDFARGVNAALVVVGVSRRPRWQTLFSEGVGARVVAESGSIDVHVVSHDQAGRGSLPPRSEVLGRSRRLWAWLLAILGAVALTAVLWTFRDVHEVSTDIMLFLALTVAVALVGGLRPAITTAVVGSLLLNWFLTPPYYRWTINDPENVLALVVFVLVAIGVASVVDLAARRTLQAAHSSSEAETLSALSGAVLRGEDTVAAILGQVRQLFGMTSVTLLERPGDQAAERSGWVVVGSVGSPPCTRPDEGDTEVPVSESLSLALRGPVLDAGERRVLEAFAAQAAVALERERLRERAAAAGRLEAGDATRTALLAAVSHDLRTPLASIKAGVSSLRQDDVEWSADDEAALLATVADSADRLERLIDNLLDVSRLNTGTVHAVLRVVSLEEIVPLVLDSVAAGGVPGGRVRLDLPESLPLVRTDPGLLERALANVVENAVRHAPSEHPVTIGAAVVGRREAGRQEAGGREVEVRVVDRGPGVAADDRVRMFHPFQRLGDTPAGDGVGLGLAVARGFVEAVGGRLEAEDTPGGGLTMVITVPVAAATVTAAEASA